ncbi:DUF2752 domain-containing protein [Gordonia defluvii]|jgi:hypothetical protein|uniref:DUF2752 domain-containing protein n=2 Tax=Gordoniaceae TaxID=85026 RepID=A0ABP6L5V3_9ACTN
MDEPLTMAPESGADLRRAPDRTDRLIAVAERFGRNRLIGPVAVVVGVAAVGTVIWFGDPTTPGGHLPTCPTKSLLGIVCPGCGTMRMVDSLMHGDFRAAVHYNAVGLVALFLLAWSFVAYCVRLWSGRRWRTWQHWRYSAMVILVVVVAWFVIRNIPIAPFTALRV